MSAWISMVDLHRTRHIGLLCFILALSACENERSGWTHASVERFEDEVWPSRYNVAHYDPVADVCVLFTLRDEATVSAGHDDSDDEVDIKLRGAAGYVLSAAQAIEAGDNDDAARNCTSSGAYSATLVASGSIRLSDFSNTLYPHTPCKISYELEVENVYLSALEEDERHGPYYASASKHPIATLGCPQPKENIAEPADIDAAYAHYEGLDNLVIAAWDVERSVCAWARFVRDDIGQLEATEVEAPDTWVYTGLRFQRITQGACVAAELIEPRDFGYALGEIYTPLRSGGSLAFATSESAAQGEGELPCTLDLDLRLVSPGEYFWTPDELHLRRTGLPVSGACD